jgi:hypothetical protein
MNSFRGTTLKRLVSLLLISLTCLCIFEDLFALNSCGEDGTLALPQSRAMVLSQTASSQQPSPTDFSDKDHDCFCCCRHVLVAGFPHPIQILSVSFIDSTPLKAVPSVDLLPAYHPPRV